jgi:hypothetical protein
VSNPFFLNVTRLLRDNPAQLNYGAAVTDVDGDGENEIFVAGYSGPSLVLKWVGDRFVNIADAVLSNVGRRAIGVAACDMDSDGREEIYVLNTDTFAGPKHVGDRLFKWVDGRWLDLFELPENVELTNLMAGRSVGCLDRLGTGCYGFFVANYGGPMRLFELIRDSLELVDAAPELGLNRITGGRAILAGPILDKRMDVFLNNENGRNFFFENKGDGTFEEIATEIGLEDLYEHGRGVAAFDANGDGRLDLVYGNWEGPHRLMIQNDIGYFSDVTPPEMARPSKVRTVIAADFDNDGFDEIFFNNILEPNRLFGLRGNRWFPLNIGDALEPEGAGTGAAIGDFEGNGQLKLVIAHGESLPQPLSLFTAAHGDAALNNWLRIRPLTPFGAPARGAVVRLHAGDRLQTRLVDAGSGYLCQMEPVAHFGLGSQNQIDYAEITWPDGSAQRIGGLEANSVITVRKGE